MNPRMEVKCPKCGVIVKATQNCCSACGFDVHKFLSEERVDTI